MTIGRDLVVLDAHGDRRVVAPPAAFNLAWSPDGGEIAFERELGEAPDDIWVVHADGSELRRLTRQRAYEIEPAWSPDGKQILFVSVRSGGHRELYVMNADGSEQRRLTRTDMEEHDPAWSPDGRRIAFSAFDAKHLEFDLWIIDVDGRNRALFAAGEEPDWSPDGMRIAFVREGAIWFANVDRTRKRALTRSNDEFSDHEPSWSPDGRWLVFRRLFSEPPGAECWAIRANGTGLRRLAGPACCGDRPPRSASRSNRL
jgi:TolB protein